MGAWLAGTVRSIFKEERIPDARAFVRLRLMRLV
jgi:hypothetical protein